MAERYQSCFLVLLILEIHVNFILQKSIRLLTFNVLAVFGRRMSFVLMSRFITNYNDVFAERH